LFVSCSWETSTGPCTCKARALSLNNTSSTLKWYLHMVLICICLMFSEVKHLKIYLLAFVFLLFRNVCLDLSSIKIGFCSWVVWVPYIIWKLVISQMNGL
jgi:hypothetical protein